MLSSDELTLQLEQLREENSMLKALLHAQGISVPNPSSSSAMNGEKLTALSAHTVTKRSSLCEKTALYLSLFQGRTDVYARRWESRNGRYGYSPASKNEWKPGTCLKPKGRCADCSKAEYLPYGPDAVEAHLHGLCVLGIYPLLKDDTCRFLAIDFDEEQWRSDVQMVAASCIKRGISCSIEISRSGNGAHLWIFFSEAINAGKARTLGASILTLAMQDNARLSFKSYDRMFPNQDTMPKFIGEGFDDSRLDTLFLTMPISWQGTLAQYVGRLHRLHEGKHEVRVYDYIDNHTAMLEKMYRKRLKGYSAIGYTAASDQDASLSSDIIYDQNTFQDRFLQDLSQAKETVVIVSPYVTSKRVKWLENTLQQCMQKQVRVTVTTRRPESLPASSEKAARTAIENLRQQKVNIVCKKGIHQKYAIIDNSIVWYGSINLLSFGASQESIMRLVSSSIARALIGNDNYTHCIERS